MSPARRRRRTSSPDTQPLSPERMEELGPAERMQAFRHEQKTAASQRGIWVQTLPYRPDDFQVEAMDAVEEGNCVLVAAPTGAGKTVVAEFAIHLARQQGTRVFYTTPIKALSNQKFADLRNQFGQDNVGLLTGDTTINPGASIVVMTTEVLRNMIHAGADLTALSHVILDEVHYLADRFRGPVWEEVIIHLPAHVVIVALSATVSNAEELGAWIKEVRSSCRIVVSEERPVPLYQHMMVGRRLFDLYAPSRRGKGPSKRLNPELLSMVSRGAYSRAGKKPVARESRESTVSVLAKADLLPAIVFVFSRQGCEDAVQQVIACGVDLTSAHEASLIRRHLDTVVSRIDAADHAVLGIHTWMYALERGIAAHHAGLLPVMKEAVEYLFTRGLVKVVFATETLALGINMPARTVVIESLRKWNGAAHVSLSPGEYTQLSGRAGRRGIDTEGHAVVLHRGTVAPEEVAALASKRTYPLVSAFRPTYNMVVNLLRHSSRERAREVLESSFAQFQADASVVSLAQQVRSATRMLEELEERVECEAGDAREYFWLREEIARLQKEDHARRRNRGREQAREGLAKTRVGDVVRYRRGRRTLHSLVYEIVHTARGGVSVEVLGPDGRLSHLAPEELTGWGGIVGHLRIPPAHVVRRPRQRAALAQQLRHLLRSGTLQEAPPLEQHMPDTQLYDLEKRLRHHPVHRCPERETHASAGHAWARQRRELDRLLAIIEGRTNSVATEFDRVYSVLDSLDFLEGEKITPAGEMLTHIFGERDLLVVEAIRMGAFRALAPAELAALVSCFVYEARGEGETLGTAPRGISPALSRAWDLSKRAWERVLSAEVDAGARPSLGPDPSLMLGILAWAHGASLATALEACEMQGGDFVRWTRQVIDLLDQVSRAGQTGMGEQARLARKLLSRGVVAWSAL